MVGRVATLVTAASMAGAGVLAAAPAPVLASTTATVKIVPSGTGTCTALFCFRPAKVKVAHGSTVHWTNRSASVHTVTRCTVAACGVGGGTGTSVWNGSGLISSGTGYSFTFQGAGTYVYYCSVHGYAVMHGTVTVTP